MKSRYIITHLLYALVLAKAVNANRREVPYRINAGFTETIVDRNNTEWLPDADFYGGKTFKDSTCGNTTDPKLYCSERYGKSFKYEFRLREDQGYTIELHFAEFFHKAVGKRVFNVSVDDRQVAVNLDLIATVGYRKPYIITVNYISISENFPFVNIYLNSSIDNAKISGIAVYPYNRSIDALTAPVRINAGASQNWTDPISNVVWLADDHSVWGDVLHQDLMNQNYSYCRDQIAGTSLDSLSCDVRYSKYSFRYSIHMKPGDYIVRLLFVHIPIDQLAPPFDQPVGQPVNVEPNDMFNVTIQDELVVQDLNVFQLVGHNRSLVISYSATVQYDKDLNINFIPTRNYAFVQAIEIVSAGLGGLG